MASFVNTAGRFVAKNKKEVVIVLIILIVGIVFYRKGKSKVNQADLPNDRPNTGETGNGGVNLSGKQISTNDIARLRDALYEDITEMLGTRNNQLYEELVTLSDTDLVEIYNAYNKSYGGKDAQTLIQALQGELTAFFSFTAMGNMKTVITRLQKYNLK